MTSNKFRSWLLVTNWSYFIITCLTAPSTSALLASLTDIGITEANHSSTCSSSSFNLEAVSFSIKFWNWTEKSRENFIWLEEILRKPIYIIAFPSHSLQILNWLRIAGDGVILWFMELSLSDSLLFSKIEGKIFLTPQTQHDLHGQKT